MSAAPQIRTPQQESSIRSPQWRERQRDTHARKSKALRIFQRTSLALCCMISFGVVWMIASKQAAVYSMSYQNTDLQMKIKQQSAVNASLNADVAALKKPSRILNAAINKDHLQYKTPVDIPSTSGK